ncbi:MAG: FtsW/RodA/SpoVE family cell cycle protein, partial [Chlamydiales bacterium]
MWSARYLTRIDFRVLPVIFCLMMISLLVVSSYTLDPSIDHTEELFFTPVTRTQAQWFALGIATYFFFAGLDYNKLREWTWLLYGLMLLSLIGLFFTDSIQ